VDSARDTVVELDVQLGDGIFLVDRGFLKITDSSSFYHVTNGETLDGLILGDTTVTVDTTNNLVMATTVLVTSVISSFTGLCKKKIINHSLSILAKTKTNLNNKCEDECELFFNRFELLISPLSAN
jgi:hypothetical protein